MAEADPEAILFKCEVALRSLEHHDGEAGNQPPTIQANSVWVGWSGSVVRAHTHLGLQCLGQVVTRLCSLCSCQNCSWVTACCLGHTEANIMASAFEKRKHFIVGSASKETDSRAFCLHAGPPDSQPFSSQSGCHSINSCAPGQWVLTL